jgi:hypothetical protein
MVTLNVSWPLTGQSDWLTSALRALIVHPYSPELWRLEFEVHVEVPNPMFFVAVRFYQSDFEEVSGGRQRSAGYPVNESENARGSPARVGGPSATASVPADQDVAYAEFAQWFLKCWKDAGGASFGFEASLWEHDAERRLDLLTGEWVAA